MLNFAVSSSTLFLCDNCSLVAQMQPIHMGVKDAHPYVRRTAVMGVLKVYNLDKAAVRNAGRPPHPIPPILIQSILMGGVHSWLGLSTRRNCMPSGKVVLV